MSMVTPDGKYTYNPPPKWPAPPTWWVTPDREGFAPDPSWGPIPAGWVLWVPVEPTKPDVYTDPDKLDLRPSFKPAVAMARKRHNDEVNARRKPSQADVRALPTPPPQPIAAAVSTALTEPEDVSHPVRKSFGERHADKKLVRAQAEQVAREVAARQAVLAKRVSLQEQIDFVNGWPGNAPRGNGLVLKKDEHPVAVVMVAGLVEVKRGQGHFVAGSAGMSVRVAKGMRVRAGQTRGHMVPGDEAETQIDSGSAVITNTRIVFSGSRQTREWKFDNLVGRNLVGNRQMSWIELPVSNRQKMSALSFPKTEGEAVSSAVELALLFHSGEQQPLVEELRRQLAELAD